MTRRPILAALCALALAPTPAAAQADELLQKLVIVSRHGVRTPTASPVQLANWAAEPWPEWGQPPAALTPRGAQLAALMGRYYREYAGVGGALPAAGCPAPGTAFVYADTPERTQATARAIAEGFAANCGIEYRTRQGAPVDPLFHPLQAGVCRLDPMVAQTRVLERAGGDLNRTSRDLKSSFAALQSVLGCCKPALCTAFGRGEKCELAELPTAMIAQPDGSGISLIGALAIASTTSELLLLEYANDMPPADVGWGRATPATIRDTLRLHTEEYDLMQRTPYLARRMGSALLSKVAAAVTSARALGFGPVDPAVRDAKFVAYVGYDTNLWNLAGMLNVSWLQPGYQRNQTPPAGALTFEVRETKERKLVVYTAYVAQSMEQMRNATALTMDAPPARTPLKLPGCSTDRPGFPCPIEEFAIAVRNSIDRDCVE
ncbi:MAG: histidine-type phosphatase [Burkholderiales bacterium]